MLNLEKCCLVIVDVQSKLAQLMYEKEALFKNIQIFLKAAKILNIPILYCQQCSDALGETIPQLTELLAGNDPINKASFSCCPCDEFNTKLKKLDKQQILLCGIETHVCIYQTALDLLSLDKEVNLIVDAVSSRTLQSKQIATDKMKTASVIMSTVEMALFELLKTAEHKNFKEIIKLVK